MSAVFAASATFGRGSISSLRRRRHPGRDFLRRERVLDVEDAHAGVVVGREDRLLAAEASRAGSRAGCAARTCPSAQKSRSGGVGSVAIGTGFSGARTSTTKVWNVPLAHVSALASSATTARLRPGSGSAVCVPPGNGGDQLMCDSSFGVARIADVVDREPAVAPGAVATIAGDDQL